MKCREIISSIFIGYLMITLFHTMVADREKKELRELILNLKTCQTYNSK